MSQSRPTSLGTRAVTWERNKLMATGSGDARSSPKKVRLEEHKTTPSGGFRIPESDDGTLLADVALGLVLGSLRGSHPVQDGQPHHGLGLQSHPV